MLNRLVRPHLVNKHALFIGAARSMSIHRHTNINIEKFKNKQAALDTRYFNEDEQLEETPRGIAENTLINVNLIVERIPVVPAPLKDWEVEYREYSALQLYEKGTHFPDAFQKLVNSKQGVRLLEDAVEKTVTKDDEINDHRSMHRCLNEPVYLLFKIEEGQGKKKKGVWQFPRGEWREGETVRQTAERTIFYFAGEGLEYHMLGNAPIAYHNSEMTAEQKKSYPQATQLKVCIYDLIR